MLRVAVPGHHLFNNLALLPPLVCSILFQFHTQDGPVEFAHEQDVATRRLPIMGGAIIDHMPQRVRRLVAVEE
jgi:hypothetical protein